MSVKVHEAYCLDSQQHRLLWWDDFLGDQIQDEWNSAGTGGGSSVVIDQQTGGIVRLTTNAALNADWQINWNAIRSIHSSKKPSNEYRVKLNSSADILIFLVVQFNGTNRLTSFTYDSSTDTNWQIQCVNGGATTEVDTGIAVDTSYHIFRAEYHIHGSNHVHYYIDGIETGNSPITTNVYTGYGDPILYLQSLAVAAKSMDIDYVVVRQDI